MKFFKDEKVKKNLVMGFILIAFFFALYNISSLWLAFKELLTIFAPFILGAAIAFVLNVPMSGLEKKILRNRKKFSGKKWDSRRRTLSLVITLLLTIIVFALILYMVIPQLAVTITQLIRQIPEGVKNVTDWASETFARYPIIQQIIDEVAKSWSGILQNAASILKNYVNAALEGGINILSGLVSGVANFVIGFIFSMYILVQKEKLGVQAKKIVYALFSKETADRTMVVAGLASKTFSNFISGQCVEAIILGLMFAVSMLILRIPYAVLVGVLIAATALIPIVGAFIGCAIGVLLILLDNPVKALVFLILFLVLQQIEGNIIYPKVVGGSIGLPGLWVLMAVTVGGNLFGVKGMIIFIPLVSVAYALFREFIYKKLDEKGILQEFKEEDELEDNDEKLRKKSKKRGYFSKKTLKEEKSKEEKLKEETSKEEASKEEKLKEETSKEEASKEEKLKEETSKEDISKKEIHQKDFSNDKTRKNYRSGNRRYKKPKNEK